MAGAALGLLVLVMTCAIAGLWQVRQGVLQNRTRIRRSTLEDVEARASRPMSRLDAALRRTALGQRLGSYLISAGVGVTVAQFVLIDLAVAVSLVIIVGTLLGRVFAVPAALAGVTGSFAWARKRQSQRGERFIAQLPELARVLSNAVGAGLALRTAIAMAADELDEPARLELRRTADALTVGHPIDDALNDLRARLPSRELGVLVSTLVIQHRAGGQVSTALRNLSETLDARKELRREVRTATAQSVFSGYMVIVLGVGTLLLLNLINPGTLSKLVSTPAGVAALVVSGTLFSIGFFLIRRLTRVDV